MPVELLLFVGTYTRLDKRFLSGAFEDVPDQTNSKGIYTCQLNTTTGSIRTLGVTPQIENPTFLTTDSRSEHVYAVSESQTHNASVTAYSITRTGSLNELNVQSTGGPGACHISLDHTGQYAVIANYHGGSVCSLPVRKDGSLGERSAFIQHTGSSVTSHRQEHAHAHSAIFDKSNERVYVCDLGMDAIVVYCIDLSTGMLRELPGLRVRTSPGDGPRHITFHPSQPFAYVVNELGSTVCVYTHTPKSGKLIATQRASTLPSNWHGTNFSADIHVSPDGRFLYASNRGHDSIAIFSIDLTNGELESRGQTSTRGEWPRNFAVTDDGKFLLVANQNSNNIVVFGVDEESGQLKFSGHELEVPAPVCLKLWSPT